MMIHPLADVSASAEIGSGVRIGAFCVVEAGVKIGDNTQLAPRSTIKAGTTLGANNFVGEGAVLGGMPQHLHQPPQPGGVLIGDRNVIRENATIHRAMKAGSNTTIGNECLLMVGAHIAHDCNVASNVVLTNNVMLGGHVTVGERACLGGGVAVHQHCRIGRIVMIGGLARLDQDVPPFVLIDGESNQVVGLNRVGLRRAGLDPAERNDIKLAYRRIYHAGLSFSELLETLQSEFPVGPAAEFASFLADSTRGFVRERRRTVRATLRIMPELETADADELPAVLRKAG